MLVSTYVKYRCLKVICGRNNDFSVACDLLQHPNTVRRLLKMGGGSTMLSPDDSVVSGSLPCRA